MSCPYNIQSPLLHNPSIFSNPKRIHRCNLQVLAMVSLPSKTCSVVTSSALHLDETAAGIRAVNFLDKLKAIPFKDTSEILSTMEKDLSNWTLSDFNGLLMALFTANEPELAMELFSNVSSLSGLDLAPNCSTFSIIIRRCCKRNDLDEAQRILHHMMGNGYNPNVTTFTFLIHSLCKRGKIGNAFRVFQVMGGIGCKPTVQTYNCLLKGLCYVGKIEQAHEMLMNMEKKESIRPDIYSYTAVMDGFCKVGRSDEAMELLNRALVLGLEPNAVTYNTLFSGYTKEGRPHHGFTVLKLMKDKNCLPDSITYSTFLNGLLKWGKIRAALKVYKEMVGIGFEVEGKMMSSLLRGLCMKSWKEKDLVQDAYQVFEKMRERVSVIDHTSYSFVIRTLCMGRRTGEAVYHLEQMTGMGHVPRTVTFNNVIQALCMEGKIGEALVVLVSMFENGKIPSRTSYDMLVKEFNRQGLLLGACNVYGAALKQGVVPHRIPTKMMAKIVPQTVVPV
ncbi:hypothetical protein V6N13_080046 [Hibiscus sabdariffa]|uniref:PROP1-like PPR domain-containing protein n=1 Tax=Hibiscus sabdariffa TaxID=183260 RepID=A0ABR2RT76_9ROSI